MYRLVKHTFLFPTLLILLFLGLFPLLCSLGISLTDWGRNIDKRSFVGLSNYKELLFSESQTGQRFRRAMVNTMVYVGGGLAFQYPIGLILALCLRQKLPFRKFLRILFLVPLMLTPVATGWLFKYLLRGEGGINQILGLAGIKPILWLTDYPVLSVILVDSWQWIPFMMLVLLAALESLPTEPYEAAQVDGASAWQTFWHITFPLLWPASVTIILIRAVEIFKIFDVVAVLTGGGAGGIADSIMVYAKVKIDAPDFGSATALGYLLLVAITALSLGWLKLTRQDSQMVI